MSFIDQSSLALIAARSATLAERRSRLYSTTPLQDDQPAAIGEKSERIQRWAQAVAKGDRAHLQERLAKDGLTLEKIDAYLGPVTFAGHAELPRWTNTLAAIVEAATAMPGDYLRAALPNPDRCIDLQNPLPFEELLVPMVAVGRQQLQERLARTPASPPLAEAAYVAAERFLLARLEQVSSPTLYHVFWRERVRQEPVLAFTGMPEPEGNPLRAHYAGFVQQTLRPENLRVLFEEYAVMARLLAETIDTWVTVVFEFLTHLAADWPAIGRRFGEIGRVENLAAGLSDPHHGGRTVFRVEFDSGLKLIYKPHALAMEQAYQDFVGWINASGKLLALKTLEILDRHSHGWVGFVTPEACATTPAVARYFTRCGMLIALNYVLSGTDLHFENIIASGEHPVPIDLEMLINPPVVPALSEEAGITAAEQHTVLDSGILPVGNPRATFGMDLSFLGVSAEPLRPARRRRLYYPNSDHMKWKEGAASVDESDKSYILYLDDAVQRPQAHLSEIVCGFRQMYRFLCQRKEELLAGDSPLNTFQNLPSRFIFRPTYVYFRVLRSSLQPDCMREGIDRTIQLEHLSRVHSQGDSDTRRFWKLLQDEIAALEGLDIPYFNMSTGSRSLTTTSGGVISDCFVDSGFDYVRQIVATLSEEDMQRQAVYLRQALTSKLLRPPGEANGPSSAHNGLGSGAMTPANDPPLHILEPGDFLAEAEKIAVQIIDAAAYYGRQARWLAIDLDPDSMRYFLDFVGYDLYDGRSGIAFFLAALWQQSPKAIYRRTALAALFDLRKRLEEGRTAVLSRLGIGGADGLGSLVYALTRTAGFLEDASLITAAEQAAELITPELIAEDEQLDVMGGAAGAILGLLALYEVTRADEILARAAACGCHLVDRQVESEHGGRAWPTLGGKILTGFSHGAAGIAYALLKLHALTGDDDFRRAALAGIAYEQSLFVPDAGNWPDLRHEGGFMASWCHGAPGIALARLAGFPGLEETAVYQDVNNGLRTTYEAVMRANLAQTADLCCGHLGRAEILLSGGRELANDAYRQAGAALASRLVHEAHKNGGYVFIPGLPPDIIQPGLFKGLAGIGYSLLRLASPAAQPVPSVLLWE